MRGLGLTIAEDYTPPAPVSYPAPTTKPYYGYKLPYFRTSVPNGSGTGPNGEPGEYINGVFYPAYATPVTSPVTTSAPVVSVAQQSDSGPFGLSSNTFKLILLGGLAYLILKK